MEFRTSPLAHYEVCFRLAIVHSPYLHYYCILSGMRCKSLFSMPMQLGESSLELKIAGLKGSKSQQRGCMH